MEVKVSKDKYITRNVVWEMFLYAGQKQHQKRSTKMDGDRLRKKIQTANDANLNYM